jgi:hypothetical protein
MPKDNLHIGDVNTLAAGSINLQSTGKGITIDAGGLEGSLQLSGATTAGMQSGAAALVLSNEEEEIGKAVLTVGEIGTVQLGCGPPELGAMITLEPEAIVISCGAPGVGAAIRMTAESITLSVAEVTFTMTPAGIIEEVAECNREHTPEGHNLMAAETEFNIGIQGESKELPTAECEVEGGLVHNETVGEQTSDAMRSQDAGITMTV